MNIRSHDNLLTNILTQTSMVNLCSLQSEREHHDFFLSCGLVIYLK